VADWSSSFECRLRESTVGLLASGRDNTVASHPHRIFAVGNRRNSGQLWFPQQGSKAEKVECLHRRCPSLWGFRAAASFCRPISGCKHVEAAEVGNSPPSTHVPPFAFFLRCVPDFSVHTRSFLASIFRHSPNSEYLCRSSSGVSSRCKACTLPHLPSFVGPARYALGVGAHYGLWLQLMAYHSAGLRRETAPTAFAVVICFVSCADLISFSC